VEDREHVPPCQSRLPSFYRGQPGTDSAIVKTEKPIQSPIRLLSTRPHESMCARASFQLDLALGIPGLFTPYDCAGQDDSDRCLPTETAVSCTRISRVSGRVDHHKPFDLWSSLARRSPRSVWALRGSIPENMKRFTTPYPLW